MFKTQKMTNKYAVSAFSIVETVVGLIITAVIMSIIFVIFSIVTERMYDYKNQNQLVNDMNRLTYSINKDIFETEKMEILENEIAFIGYSGKKINYLINPEYLLRINETFIDTFKVTIKKMVVDSAKNESKKLVFLKLKIDVEVNKSDFNLKFYKRVYANQLIDKAIKE